MDNGNLLEIQNLRTYFDIRGHVAKAVDDASLAIGKGETLGLVGESGCGKSVTAHSIMQLIPQPPGQIVGGKIFFEGQNILELSEAKMRKIRGCRISMIFQEPMTSLNPVFSVGDQVGEVIRLHEKLSRSGTRNRVIQMFQLVGIPEPEKRLSNYPHQMSGGMRQRVMIAMALSCNPDLLIADEPTTALDVTIQSQILDLMMELQQRIGMAILLITHDLGVVAEVCEWVAVMYAGVIVEYGNIRSIYKDPKHPYTTGLLNTIPKIDESGSMLKEIEGEVPRLIHPPSGCRFHPRCAYAMEQCSRKKPDEYQVGDLHTTACFLYQPQQIDNQTS